MVSLGAAEISHRFQKLVVLSETKDRTSCHLTDWWRPDAVEKYCGLRYSSNYAVILPQPLGENLKWTAPGWYKLNDSLICYKRDENWLHTHGLFYSVLSDSTGAADTSRPRMEITLVFLCKMKTFLTNHSRQMCCIFSGQETFSCSLSHPTREKY